MLSDKKMKIKFKRIAQKEPRKYYPIQTLENLDFKRKKCKKCQTFFWTTTEREYCDDPKCSGSFRFIEDSPAKNKLDYIEAWKKFSEMFKKFGYTPIKRYPVVSRWNTTVPFTIASIAAFQPYVVSGEVEPPANPLVIPQFCLRFSDIDNVGVTGHMVGFIMDGQHAFVPKSKYDTNEYLNQIFTWLNKGIGLSKDEITFHEDAWAGNKNFGSSLEFFSRGLEIGNQVYMQYEQTSSGYKELPIKVLDMGMGQERVAWFSQGKTNCYESTFPTVCKKLYEITGIRPNNQLVKMFLPYSSYLNFDEAENINKAWELVAKNVKTDVNTLKKEILPLAGLYSIAEHTRALLVALADSALPSNVGGGYNLRVIFRRALGFIDRYGWKINMNDIASWHADYLKPLYPELKENIEQVKKILDVEKQKYLATKQKTASIVARLVKEEINEKKLMELYDSQGITPELVREEAAKIGKKVEVSENFYAKVNELHEKQVQEHQTKHDEELDLDELEETKALYYQDWKLNKFKSKIKKIIGNNVVLQETLFYPTSGGQLHDLGTLNGKKIVDVIKQGKHIVHVLEDVKGLKVNQEVNGEVEFERRKQLAQHHTSTHIVNAAARKILGNHANQAGAKKTLEKAHIDITHYNAVSDEELKKIEDEANKIIKNKIPIIKSFMSRTEAEQKYGMTIYQGGVPPGKVLRIVNILNTDVEACGGTHLDNTSEAEKIKILKATKLQDGIVRIEFTAGKAAMQEENKDSKLIEECAKLLKCDKKQVPGRAKELFEQWKLKKKGKLNKFELKSKEKENLNDKELLDRAAMILKTQPVHVVNTIKKFLKDL